MQDYLQYQFTDSPEFVNTFDELPLWSASFGLLLLKHVELRPAMTVVDIGSGAGFPLLELALRLGNTCKLYGIDPWANANARARQKINNYGITNTEIIEQSAEQMPFSDASIDLIVSNLGINNFEHPAKVFAECSRVLKPGGKLALTTNVNGHWQEFYDIFEETLQRTGNTALIPKLKEQQEHRGSRESIAEFFTHQGMKVNRWFEDRFEMRFLDGSTFLNHYFVKLGWLASWKELIPEAERVAVFGQLEEALNEHAQAAGSLSLTVPMLFIEGIKM